jgi:hypothetical protein
LRAACADQEKIECRFVRATISSAVIGAPISVVVMALLLSSFGAFAVFLRAFRGPMTLTA